MIKNPSQLMIVAEEKFLATYFEKILIATLAILCKFNILSKFTRVCYILYTDRCSVVHRFLPSTYIQHRNWSTTYNIMSQLSSFATEGSVFSALTQAENVSYQRTKRHTEYSAQVVQRSFLIRTVKYGNTIGLIMDTVPASNCKQVVLLLRNCLLHKHKVANARGTYVLTTIVKRCLYKYGQFMISQFFFFCTPNM